MKRLAIFTALLISIAAALPAEGGLFSSLAATGRNTELDINYYLMPVNRLKLDTDDVYSLSRPAYFGLEADARVYLITSEYLDAGMSFGANFDTAYDIGFSFAPAGRVTFANFASLVIAPGLKLGIPFGSYKDRDGDKEYFGSCFIAFSADIGFRLWLINDGDRLFGLSTGVTLGCPIPGLIFSPNTKSGFSTAIYLGICYNFGSRGFDLARRQ